MIEIESAQPAEDPVPLTMQSEVWARDFSTGKGCKRLWTEILIISYIHPEVLRDQSEAEWGHLAEIGLNLAPLAPLRIQTQLPSCISWNTARRILQSVSLGPKFQPEKS